MSKYKYGDNLRFSRYLIKRVIKFIRDNDLAGYLINLTNSKKIVSRILCISLLISWWAGDVLAQTTINTNTFQTEGDDTDKKYITSLLETIIFENIKFDYDLETRDYALYKSKQIVEGGDIMDDKIREKLYNRLLEDIDIYKRLGAYSRKLISEYIYTNDSADKPFYKLTYRERDLFFRDALVQVFSAYLIIDMNHFSITEKSSGKIIPSNQVIMEDYAKIILGQ